MDQRSDFNSYFLNVGSNEEISIKELAFKVKEIVGFKELAVEKLLEIKDLIGSLSIGSEVISSDIEDILKEKGV